MINSLDVFTRPAEVRYFNSEESDLVITDIGYNDFSVINGVKIYRKQNMYTLHYIIGGKGFLNYGGKEYSLSGGMFFILPKNEEFRYYPDKTDPWKYIWFGFEGKTAEKHFNAVKNKFYDIAIESIGEGKTAGILEEYVSALSAGEEIGYYKILSVFYSLLDELEFLPKPSGGNNIVSNAKEYIRLNAFNPEFTVDILCKLTHMSHSYLCRLFLSGEKTNIKKYVTGIRMIQAMKLVSSTDMKIKNVAYSVGYYDELNFMKVFKKYYGKSCNGFRNKK